MVRLVDAAMISWMKQGLYFPESTRKIFKIRVVENTSYVLEISADCSDSAKVIANKIFGISKDIFEKECSVKVIDCDDNRKRSAGRIRQSFSRYDP